MTISIKPGVQLLGIRPEIAFAMPIVGSVYAKYGYDCTITSGTEGKHKRASAHSSGRALDFRKRNVSSDKWPSLVESIKSALGAAPGVDSDFDVIDERTHLHVEYDPKRGVNQ